MLIFFRNSAPHQQPVDIRHQIDRSLRQGNCRLLVARRDGTICGGLSLTWYDHPLGRRGWIEDVVVDQAFRRQGIAGRLIRRAQAEATALGITHLQLTSRHSIALRLMQPIKLSTGRPPTA